MSKPIKHISKFLSLVLRHQPGEIGLVLDEQGWAVINDLIAKMQAKGFDIKVADLAEIVETNDKKRFAFNADKTKIRASQGHSIDIMLDLPVAHPPEILYHGTTARFLTSILANGLQKQKRQYVHLSSEIETARAVGARYGKPIVLIIDAKRMHDNGFAFYLSENKVWLTDAVPVQFIRH